MDKEPGSDQSSAAAEHFQRGLRLAQLSHHDEAAKEFEEAAWLDPENAEVQFNLGTAYIQLGMFEQAIINLTRVLELRPGMADAWGNRAVAHAAIGNDDRCEADIVQAVKSGGNREGLETVVDYVRSRRHR